MKLPESAAFKLFDKRSLPHPKIITAPFARPGLAKVVVKADLPMGGKKKAGLVQICDIDGVESVIKKIGPPVIIEEFIPHNVEFFVALKAVREGVEVYYSALGGVDVEDNWEKVSKILVPTGTNLTEDLFFNLVPEKSVREWLARLYDFFQKEDATYLEINPFTTINKQVMPLGVVLELDEAAEFRHLDWEPIVEELGSISVKTERERKVAEVDEQIRGSVKLVEVPYSSQFTVHSSQPNLSSSTVNREPVSTVNLTAVMGGGAGSVLFLCDAVLENGLELANYAEFSGNPPDWALTELTKQVCAIPGIKNLVVGSGIANFTPAKDNIVAIIEGLRASPLAKDLNIVVRRCGPGEEEGIKIMKEFIESEGWKNIQVFDRNTGMAEVVKKLKTPYRGD